MGERRGDELSRLCNLSMSSEERVSDAVFWLISVSLPSCSSPCSRRSSRSWGLISTNSASLLLRICSSSLTGNAIFVSSMTWRVPKRKDSFPSGDLSDQKRESANGVDELMRLRVADPDSRHSGPQG